MKIGEPPASGLCPAPAGVADTEDRTRDRVCRAVLESGPVAAGDLARALGLTAAAVRRHLDVLGEQGLVIARATPSPVRRGRGRPARLFVLTDSGHAAMDCGYDALASQVLRYLSTLAGPGAVRRFAEERLAGLETRYRPVVEAAGEDPRERAVVLAGLLTADGYAARTRDLDRAARRRSSGGIQLCQGHCPVQYVAREFPELCEAETDTFSRLLGAPVQRLATLAHGEHVCTTHVPGRRPAAEPSTGPPDTPVPPTRPGWRSGERQPT
jgi:predicted ArsR family transcriptional regulator